MENNKQNNKKRLHLGLNCAIGALALLGSAGTIAFGTLWCQSRNQEEPEQTIVMDQYKMDEVGPANHYLFYSSQKINFEPNMEYKIYIDLTELPNITRSCTCFFETLTNIEDYSDQDNAKVPICNPFDFAANGHHLFGTLNQGGAPGPGIYNYIEFSEQSDYTYIDSADHIDGFINTLDWKTKTIDPAYAMFYVSIDKQ